MTTVPVFCGLDCGGGACPLVADLEDGRVVRVRNNPAAGPWLKGCRRGFALPDLHYSPRRLEHPLLRDGPRGSGKFRRAGWDEALSLVAERLAGIRAAHGDSAVLALGSAGSTGALHDTDALLRRYLNLTGGCSRLSGNYSNAAAGHALPYVLGPEWKVSGADPATMRHSEMIVLWGANILEARLGTENSSRLMEARERGAKIVVIDPRRSLTAARAATWWVPCRPGTDSALMMALLWVLADEGLVDRPFVEGRAVGWDLLEARIRGTDGAVAATPEWAEAVTGVPTADIRRLARDWAAAKPVMLLCGYSIQRTQAGGEPFRLAVALQLATGNFGKPGGSTGSLNNRLPVPRVGSLDPLDPDSAPQARVPVLRWPDLVLHGKAGGYPADIRAGYIAGFNCVNQGADVAKGIAALDSLEFSVCNELFLTPTALWCDVVLPVASPLEKADIGMPWQGNFLCCKPRAVCPRGGARPDFDIFSELADRAGKGREFTEGRDEAAWIRHFLEHSEVADIDAFMRTGFYAAPEQERVGLSAFAADPERHPLGTPSGKVELASDSWAGETGLPAIPSWRGPASDERYPLSLVTPKAGHRTHSQGGFDPDRGEPHRLAMNPRDAGLRDIAEGDRVRVRNGNGSLTVRVSVSDSIMQGVVSLAEGIWFSPDGAGEDSAGSANVLTDTGGSWPGFACVMHGIPVQVEPLG